MVFWKKKNKNNEALKSNKDIEINSKEAESYFNKSVQLYKDNKCDEALVEIDKAISDNPDNYSYYNYKGIELSTMKKDEEAIIQYDKALKLLGYTPEQVHSPGTYTVGPEQSRIADIIYNKGISLEKLGKIEDAIDMYNSIMQIDSGVKASIRACQLYYNSGKYKEAADLIGGLFTYDLDEIQGLCELDKCETSDLVNALEIVIKSCQKINETKYLDTYIDRLLELDPENELAMSLKK